MRKDGSAPPVMHPGYAGLEYDGLNMDGKQGRMFGPAAMILAIGLMAARKITENIA
jgi:hypothetical protein